MTIKLGEVFIESMNNILKNSDGNIKTEVVLRSNAIHYTFNGENNYQEFGWSNAQSRIWDGVGCGCGPY